MHPSLLALAPAPSPAGPDASPSPLARAEVILRRPASPTLVPRDRDAADDAVLMGWAAEGDRAAFDRIALRHLPRLHAVALRITGRPALAEEVAQEALVRAWTRAADFDPGRARLGTWLHRIAANLALDLVRSHAASRAAPVEAAMDLPAPDPDPEQSLAARQRRDRVVAAVAALPERQRVALALFQDAELSGAEAAAVLRVSPRALEGLLHRARRFLSARLRGEEP